MSRSKLGKIILIATAIMVWPVGSIVGGAIECEIIQFKLDRFYFAAGTERDIFGGNSFEIIYNDSAIYRGIIESSFLGACFSEPTGLTFDSLLFDSCTGLLELPQIDSVTQIELGFLNMNPASILSRATEGNDSVIVPLSDSLLRSSYGNPIVSHRIKAFHLYYLTDELHGLFSFTAPTNSLLRGGARLSSPAPFFAALIPNLSRNTNESGLLTTSLYYRFSGNNPGRIFAGDSVESFPCGFPCDSGCPRPYPFNPSTGRALLSNIDQRPTSIRMVVADASLTKAADYFADVLSRDRIRVEFVENLNKADLWLGFIPISASDPVSSLRKMIGIATGSRTPIKQMSEGIDLVTQRIVSAAGSDNHEAAYYFCKLADRAMKEDLGIFPLFRPRLFLSTDRMLKNARFDSTGGFLYEGLKLLTLPTRPQEEQK